MNKIIIKKSCRTCSHYSYKVLKSKSISQNHLPFKKCKKWTFDTIKKILIVYSSELSELIPKSKGKFNFDGDNDVGVVTLYWWPFLDVARKKNVGHILLHIGDITIGHQYKNMPKCDLGDRYVMLKTWNTSWCQIQFIILSWLSENFLRSLNNTWVLMSVTNIIMAPNSSAGD